MIGFERLKGRTPLRGTARRPGRPKLRLRRVLDIALVVICVGTLAYAVVVVDEVVGGFSLQRETPRYTERLGVVNASGNPELASQIREIIAAVESPEIAIEVVEISSFDRRQMAPSFVVSRRKDCSASRLLAERLGLDPGQVEYRPLANNTRYLTATLVIGSDKLKTMALASSVKEN